MAMNKLFVCVVFFLLATLASSTHISNAIFEDHALGRNLLQTKKSCPVDFENQNYTIITSQCKGPKYPADACCNALKQFSCPFVEQLNDLQNDCATTMFSYINLYGKYPPGLFANQCKEGKEGLDCHPEDAQKDGNNGSSKSDGVRSVMMGGFPMVVLAGVMGLVLGGW